MRYLNIHLGFQSDRICWTAAPICMLDWLYDQDLWSFLQFDHIIFWLKNIDKAMLLTTRLSNFQDWWILKFLSPSISTEPDVKQGYTINVASFFPNLETNRFGRARGYNILQYDELKTFPIFKKIHKKL